MKYSDTYREQLLLDAVRSAEDAAIQLRQYGRLTHAVLQQILLESKQICILHTPS